MLQKTKHVPLKNRVFADFDNERPYSFDIVGLSKNVSITTDKGDSLILKEGIYIYLYMPIEDTISKYVVGEGVVIPNPYVMKPYKWCCCLSGDIEYYDQYMKRITGQN